MCTEGVFTGFGVEVDTADVWGGSGGGVDALIAVRVLEVLTGTGQLLPLRLKLLHEMRKVLMLRSTVDASNIVEMKGAKW